MKTKRILWAIALAPALFLMAETTPPAAQSSTNTTPSIATVRRAGGVKRGILQRYRPQVASDLVTDAREPTSRRRAGGTKRRF